MKLLLYCTKAKPYLIRFGNEYGYNQFDVSYCKDEHISPYEYGSEILNGKIVAECDFEVEEIKKKCVDVFKYCYITDTLNEFELMNKTQLDGNTMNNYLKGENGYAIHIKNLHIFDESKELGYTHLTRAPQNMCYGWTLDNEYLLPDPCIVVSIRPEWLCKILNGEKTIECRKRILKEMIK